MHDGIGAGLIRFARRRVAKTATSSKLAASLRPRFIRVVVRRGESCRDGDHYNRFLITSRTSGVASVMLAVTFAPALISAAAIAG